MRWRWFKVGVLSAVLAAAATMATASATGAAPAGRVGGPPRPTEAFTLVVGSVLAPPHVVRGADNRQHFAYELQLLNVAPFPVTLVRIDTLDADTGAVLATVSDSALAAVVKRPEGGEFTGALGGGLTGLAVLDVSLPGGAPLPRSLVHRLTIAFDPDSVPPGFPAPVPYLVGPTPVLRGQPITIVNAQDVFSATLRARFDLVALDPRGMGDSVQIRCGLNAIVPETTLFPTSEAQFQQLRRHNREVGLSCLRETGALLRNMDTRTVAHDHEALRLALGVDQVSWLGISYGTQLGANYAEMFPRHTQAMVLDAALEHSQAEGPQVIDEIMSEEDSFNRFARWCDTAPTCVLRGQDVAAVFDRMVIGANAHPIPVAGAIRPVNGEDIRMGAKRLLTLKEPSIYGPDASWAGLSRALAATLAGNAEAFIAGPAGEPQVNLWAQLGNACTDYVPQIHSYAEMRQRMQLARQIAPHLQGASETWQVNYCIDWPVPVTNPPRTLNVRGVPTLMVHAVHDSSDPYRWALELGAQIHGSDLLTRTGDGHTSYYTSPCARAAMDAYLVHPQASPDRVCDE